jgi:hypothetical protein
MRHRVPGDGRRATGVRLTPLLVPVALCAWASAPLAQPTPDTTAADTVATAPDEATALEPLAEDEQAGDPTELLELLEELRENPLDVNRATAGELALVPGLGPLLGEAVARHRAARGPFASLPELQLVDGVTPEAYAEARPYLTIGAALAPTAGRPSPFPRVPRPGEVARGLRYTATQRVQRRLDLPRAYDGDDSSRVYPGSPERLYTRVQGRYRRNVVLNVTLEKDPGEVFGFSGDRLGYDYTSVSAGVLDVGRLDALVAGDFVAEFGQGLVLWRAAGFGKGPEATRGPLRSGRGLRPYGSVDENHFLRGAGATVGLTPALYASAFASRRTLDASVAAPDSADLADDPDVPPDADAVVTSINATGLHRTPAELARKDALGETLVGGALEWRLGGRHLSGHVGAVGYRARFDAPLVRADRPDARYNFSGQDASMLGAYADLRTPSAHVFGEVARAPGGAVGAVGGAVAELGEGSEVLVVARRYPRDFVTLHGYPFGERNGAGQNEEGVYTGLRLRPGRTWTVAGYLDLYRFPWLRFNVPRPSAGREALVYVEHRPRRWLRAYAQARVETREESADVANGVPGSTVGGLRRETRRTLRVQADYEASRSLRFRARVEGARTDAEGDTTGARVGLLAFQDVRYQALRAVRFDARLTLFDTDGFDARLYQLENDLTGVFALPVLYGRGARAYVLLTLTPAEGLSIQAKLAATWLENVRRIGSGADTVEGDRVRDLGVQVRYTF